MRLIFLTVMAFAAGTAAAAQEPPRSTAAQAGDTAARVATQPLQDLNLVRGEIPQELKAILDKPYDVSMLKTCADKREAVARLTKVLGPDIDSPQATARGQDPAEFALGAAESAASSLIPGRGLIRRVSGAEAADRQARAAVLSGQLRRAYIRGLARGTNCRIG
jgi:hypothetical protein